MWALHSGLLKHILHLPESHMYVSFKIRYYMSLTRKICFYSFHHCHNMLRLNFIIVKQLECTIHLLQLC